MSDIEVTLAQHSEQIKTLFNGLDENKKLTESVQKLALSVERLTLQLSQQESRIEAIEDNAKFKWRTVWSCVASAILGAVVAYVMGAVL